MRERGGFEAYLLAWSGRVDPDGNLCSFLHTGGAQNYGNYATRRWTACWTTARTETDTAKRKALYAKVAELDAGRHADQLPLPHPQLRRPVGQRSPGSSRSPDGMIRLQGVVDRAMNGRLRSRLLQVVPTLLLVSILVFGLQQLMPGDPALVLAGEEGANPQVLAQIRPNCGSTARCRCSTRIGWAGCCRATSGIPGASASRCRSWCCTSCR